MNKSFFKIGSNVGRRAVAALTLSSFLSLAVPVAALPSGVAVDESSGDITVRAAEITWQQMVDRGLESGESVVVGENGSVNLVFPGGNRVLVAPGSEFRVNLTDGGKPELYLLTGKVISRVNSKFSVRTFRTDAVASTGEFVLTTDPQSTDLNVLSGNAQLNPSEGQLKRYGLLDAAGLKEATLLAFGRLASQQSVGDEATFGAQGKATKGKSAGIRNERKPVTGGVGRVAPDQDILDPGKDPAAVPEETPPVSNTPPTTQPPTTPPETPPTVGGGGTPIWPFLVGLGGLAGIIIAVSSDSDDDDVVFGGGIGPNVPSPSLP